MTDNGEGVMKGFALNGETEIEREYVARTKTSRIFDQTACQYLPGGSTRSTTDSHPYPIYMDRGRGCVLTDVDGNEYIDFMNNYTVLILGHAHPKVNQAISEQTKKGVLLGAPSQNQYELAQIICERVDSVDRVRFCNTGTEAVMYALRAARAVTGRSKVVKMEGGFHGTTEQVEISVSPDPALSGPADKPISLPDTQGITEGVLQDVLVAPFNNIDATKKIINDNGKDIAAVIVEPLMGAAGMIPAYKEFLVFLREITDHHGIVLILDEIISFRLAPGGAQEIYGVKPDLTTFGKTIGGGLPVGAFGGRADIMDIFSPKGEHPIHHSGTFNGNPVTMAAGVACLKELTPEVIERINSLGDLLREGMDTAFERIGIKGSATGFGSLVQPHFNAGRISDYRSAAKGDFRAVALLHMELLEKGINMPPRGGECSISTPMAEKEVRAFLTAFEESLAEIKPFIEQTTPDLVY